MGYYKLEVRGTEHKADYYGQEVRIENILGQANVVVTREDGSLAMCQLDNMENLTYINEDGKVPDN